MMDRWPARTALWTLGIAAAAFTIPLALGASLYLNFMAQIIAIFILATTGLNIAIGLAGQYQMAQGAIMAMAAYGAAALHLDAGLPVPAAVALALLMATGLGIVVASFSARLSSHYLLLATFAIEVIAISAIRELGGVTGGANGRAAVAQLQPFGEPMVGSTPAYSTFLIAIAGTGLFAFDWLKRSYLGLGMQGARQNARLASASGINANWFKFLAVLLSAIYAAIAGILIGPVQTYLAPESFGAEITLLLLVIVVLGGPGSVFGVAAAAIILTAASQIAQSATTAWPLIYGLFVMAVLALSSRGLAGVREFAVVLSQLLGGRPAKEMPAPPTASRISSAAAAVRHEGAGAPALSVANVEKRFGGVVALDAVSLAVAAGSVHGLVGPNGSGKTTLFEVLCGFLQADAGQLTVFGREVGSLSAAQRARFGIGRSFQHPTVLRDATVLENVLLGVMPAVGLGRRLWPTGISRAAAEALETVGLLHLRNERASGLSYGQTKLLDIARVLAARPRLVLLDEPVAGVDAVSAGYVKTVVAVLRDMGSTVMLVEHNMRFVMSLCDHVTVLNTGRIIASGAPAAVANDETVIRSYLGAGEIHAAR